MKKSRFASSIVMILVLASVYSCSKKDNNNTVNSNTSSTPNSNGNSGNTSGSSGVGLPGYPSEITSKINTIKGAISCTAASGVPLTGQRINDLVYSTQSNNYSGGSDTTIYGPFTQGSSGGSYSHELFYGMSSFGELMFVVKKSNGAQVVGYDIVLSMCELRGNYTTIDNSTQFSNFDAPAGITISNSTRCGYGIVNLASQTRLYYGSSNSSGWGGSYYNSLPTTFFEDSTCR